jgi:hypothetical protein
VNRLLIFVLMLVMTPVWAEPAPAAPVAETPAIVAAPATEDANLRDENARLRLEVDRLRNDAVQAPVIDRENQQLRERILGLESERERLTHENQTLGSWRDGLKTGAGIFVIGLIIGLLLGRGRRRSGWSEV